MKENLLRLNQAFKLVEEARPYVFPNYGFQKKLKRFEVFLGLTTEEDYEKQIKDNGFTLLD